MKDKRLNSSDSELPRPACGEGARGRGNSETKVISPSSFILHPSSLKTAFSQVCTLTGLRGRWETVREHPLTICDTGHNAHGIKYVAEQLEQMMPHYRNTRIIFGMVADKDISEVVKLLPANAIYYFTQPNNHRAFPAEKLLEMFEDEGLRTLLDKGARSKDKRLNSVLDEGLRIKDKRLNSAGDAGGTSRPVGHVSPAVEKHNIETSETNVISPSSLILDPSSQDSPLSCVLHPLSNRSFPTISAALSAAFADASPEDLIFIGGSNYVVGTALQSPLLSSNPQSSEIFPTIPTSLQ